jgi:hypothetical protein
MAKVNISFKFRWSKFIQNNLMWASFCGCIKNNPGVLPRFDQYSLSSVMTPQQEMKDLEFHRIVTVSGYILNIA